MAIVSLLVCASLAGCGDAGSNAKLAQHNGKTAEVTKESGPSVEESTGQATPSDAAEADDLPNPSCAEISPPLALPSTKPERLFVTAGVGPLMCDIYVSIKGRAPYEPVDDLAAELVSAVGGTAEMPSAWLAIVDSPPIRLGQFGAAALSSETARRQAIRRYDENRDGVAQLEELRRFLLGGDWLTFSSNGVVGDTSASEFATWQLLDADADGVLTPDEIQAAPDRLRSRDDDGDEVVTAAELAVRREFCPCTGSRRRSARGRDANAAHRLGTTMAHYA